MTRSLSHTQRSRLGLLYESNRLQIGHACIFPSYNILNIRTKTIVNRVGLSMWHEFQFHCSQKLLALSPDSEFYDRFYRFKKGLLPILDKYEIDDFLILDEGRFFLLRVELSNEIAKDFKKDLDDLVNKSADFDKVTPEYWSPETDARNRIIGSRETAEKKMRISFEGIPKGGWKIETWCEGRWITKPDDLNLKTEKFARFMSKVVGRFTRAYLKEIPERVDDRWLLSVFIHLLLHSISEQRFERGTRAFPWI